MAAMRSARNGLTVQGPAGFLLSLVYFIYFFCGLTQCFESVFLPEIKEHFVLNYQEQMYTIFAKNLPFLLSLPIGTWLLKFGYKSSLACAMALYCAGTLLLVPGLDRRTYWLVLCAFFLIGLGFTVQMVAGNPLLRALGPAEHAPSRLNFGNALGAFAQILAPAMLSILIPPVAVSVAAKMPYMKVLFLVLAVLLAAITALVLLAPAADEPNCGGNQSVLTGDIMRERPAVTRAQVIGFIVIFLALGMEAALFGMFRNFLENRDIAGLSSRQSERLFTLYFAVFAFGRLTAAWIQQRVRPRSMLLVYLCAAIVCLAGVLSCRGLIAVVCVISIGFFVSILFPTLYAIYLDQSSGATAVSSGILTMGFLGCAIVPVLQGRLADVFGLQRSYIIGIFVYGSILLLAWTSLRNRGSQRKSVQEFEKSSATN